MIQLTKKWNKICPSTPLTLLRNTLELDETKYMLESKIENCGS